MYIDYECRVSIEEFEAKKHIPIKMAIEDLYNNALSRSAFKGYLIQYPLSKLKPNKDGDYPNTIRLPGVLRSMLSSETINSLQEIWIKKYAELVPDQDIKFNP